MRYPFIVAGLAMLCVCLPRAASANDRSELETMTVTASRDPVPIIGSASSVTVLNADDIATSGASSLVELLRDVPGLAVSQQGPLGALAQVRVRGAEANHVLVLIDGVEANDLSQGSEYNFAHVSLASIARIEVLRGPQSAYWGSDALAGVVHVTTVQPADGQARGNINMALGSSGTRATSGRVTVGGFAAYADWFETDGSNVSRQGSEEDGYDNLTAGLRYAGQIADNMRVALSYRRVDAENDYDGVGAATGLPVDADNVTEREASQWGARLAIDGAVRHSFRLSRADSENANRSGGGTTLARGVREQLQYQLNLGGAKHALAVVAEFEREDFDQRGSASAFGDPNRSLAVDTRSLGAEYRFTGGPFSASLSARHDDNSDFDDARSWRVRGSYRVNDTLSVFGSVGEAVKNPTFTERFGFFDTFVGNPALEPETSLALELGARWVTDQVSVEFAWFDAELENEINGFVFDPASGGFTAANLAEESGRDGVELRLVADLSPNLALTASLARLDADQPGAGGRVSEVRRPERTGSLGVRWLRDAWTVSLSANVVGTQEDDFFPPAPPYQERVDLNGFVLVRGHIAWQINDSIALTADATNLFDEDYEEVYGFRGPGRVFRLGARLSF